MDPRLQFRFISDLQDEDRLRLRREAELSSIAEPITVAYQENAVLANYLMDGLDDLLDFDPNSININADEFYINYNNVLHRFEATTIPNPLMFHRKFTKASLNDPEAMINVLEDGMNSFLTSFRNNPNFETERLNFISRLWLTDLNDFITVYVGNAGNYHLVPSAHLIAQTALPFEKLFPRIKHDLQLNTTALKQLETKPRKLRAKLHQAYPHLSKRYLQDLTDFILLMS